MKKRGGGRLSKAALSLSSRGPAKCQAVKVVKVPDRGMLSSLAVELGLAGVQVLVEEFGFCKDDSARWLESTIRRGKENRLSLLDDYGEIALGISSLRHTMEKGGNTDGNHD